MILNDTLQLDWINKVSVENRKADKILVEKVIRALLLLEGLAQSGLSFIFKGGTAVMLLQGNPKRFSIDIDIIVPEKQDFDKLFTKILHDTGFTRFEIQKRNTVSNIEKLHYKFFYNSTFKSGSNEDNILLDILIETSHYKNIIPVNIDSPFIQQQGTPVKVRIPSKEDILGDKLTAFAPNTTGIPYEKSGFSMAMEIIKQLYDIGNLFEEVKDIKVIAETFENIAKTEIQYRNIPGNIQIVLDDIFQTGLCLSTRGKAGEGDFTALQNGISQIKAYIFSESFHIEKAIIYAARAVYCAKLIETGEYIFFRFENAEQVVNWS
ncbi:MAG: nucleotidyl transferase AbiEii/AbiGii toxin family protein, partial [Candidatus Margulisiibacteriota bacterium]